MLETLFRVMLYARGVGYGAHSIKGEVRAIRRFIDGGVFFDVGANVGSYSRAILEAFGTRLGSLHCFEPSRDLCSQYLVFKDPRVTVNNIALGETAGRGRLWHVNELSGLSSLTQRRLEHHGLTMESYEDVPVASLDEYSTEKGIEEIALLKIDVEGHELSVLRGAKKLLGDGAIKCIQFEFGGCNIDSRTFFQDFWYLLAKQHHFAIYRIGPLGLSKVGSYSESNEIFLTTNYIAVAPD